MSGSAPSAYAAALDRNVVHGGSASARISCVDRKCPPFATLTQGIRADLVAGQRIRLSAWVKAEGKVARPRIWMRVDGHAGQTLAFDNRDGSAKRAPFDWQLQQIVLDVAPDAAFVYIGLILDGDGPAWIDDVTLEAVSKRVSSTNRLGAIRPPTPEAAAAARRRFESAAREFVNLDFEADPARP